mgnify:CR=1 FL=1
MINFFAVELRLLALLDFLPHTLLFESALQGIFYLLLHLILLLAMLWLDTFPWDKHAMDTVVVGTVVFRVGNNKR